MDAKSYGYIRVISPVDSSQALINLDHVTHVLAYTNTAPKHLMILFFPSGSNQAFEYNSLADAKAARDAIYDLLNAQSVIRDV